MGEIFVCCPYFHSLVWLFLLSYSIYFHVFHFMTYLFIDLCDFFYCCIMLILICIFLCHSPNSLNFFIAPIMLLKFIFMFHSYLPLPSRYMNLLLMPECCGCPMTFRQIITGIFLKGKRMLKKFRIFCNWLVQ